MRDATRGGSDAIQNETTKRFVVRGKLAVAVTLVDAVGIDVLWQVVGQLHGALHARLEEVLVRCGGGAHLETVIRLSPPSSSLVSVAFTL